MARPILCSRIMGLDRAGDPAEQVGGLDRIEIAGGTQYSDRQRTHRGLAQRLGRVAKSGPGAKRQTLHQKPTTIFEHWSAFHALQGASLYQRCAIQSKTPTSYTCVYRKLKSDYDGDGARQGWRVNT